MLKDHVGSDEYLEDGIIFKEQSSLDAEEQQAELLSEFKVWKRKCIGFIRRDFGQNADVLLSVDFDWWGKFWSRTAPGSVAASFRQHIKNGGTL